MDICPEISDLIIDYDPDTLERRPVSKQAVLERFRDLNNQKAINVVREIPATENVFDDAAVAEILLRSHYELQRVSELFEQGRRVFELLQKLLPAIRSSQREYANKKLRIVDIGCGIGFVVRWLAAHFPAEANVELIGADYNTALIAEANLLAKEEGLPCTFIADNAFTLDVKADIFLSTGVLHHFRGDSLTTFFRNQDHPGLLASAHFDFQAMPISPLGSWMFHEILMREPLAKHDGVLSSRRAHKHDFLLQAAQTGLADHTHQIHNSRLWGIPFFPRAMHAVLSLKPELKVEDS